MERIQITNHTFSGGLWFAGWMFTIGFLHLGLVQAIYAIIIWPYYIGVAFAR